MKGKGEKCQATGRKQTHDLLMTLRALYHCATTSALTLHHLTETFGNNHESIMALPNKAKRLNCDSWSHGTMTIRICDVVWHHDDLMASFKYLLCLR